MKSPFRLRTAMRGKLPWFLIDLGICGKGGDCEKHGGTHQWYNQDDMHSACYHCRAVREGQLWRSNTHADVTRTTIE